MARGPRQGNLDEIQKTTLEKAKCKQGASAAPDLQIPRDPTPLSALFDGATVGSPCRMTHQCGPTIHV